MPDPVPAQPLKIGIDARAAVEVSAGRGRLVRELLLALAERDDPHTYVCYARRAWDAPLDARFQWRLIATRDPAWHVRAARDANRRCDVFLSSNSYLTLGFLKIPGVPIVYDLVTFDRRMRPNRRSMAIERLTLGLAVRRAARILAISEATASDLVTRHPQVAARLDVAPLAVSPSLSADAAADLEDLPAGGFVLAVGTLEPRKNLPRLVAAYRSLAEDLQRAYRLAVVGDIGWDTGETLSELRSLGDRAQLLGYVSDAALAELYRRCTVFCYPSLGEGFGLPVLEAMAAGAPVVTSDVSSLPEVGGDAVAYVDPLSVQSIAAALDGLLRSPERRAELAERGRDRARAFSWARTAELVLASLERAAQQR
jgi:glycosyltransferase involved in cell wall biosynthesis